MEPISLLTPLIATLQIWQSAARRIKPDTKEHELLLRDYSLYMNILEECIGIVQRAKEDSLTYTVRLAGARCSKIGGELAHKQAKLSAPANRGGTPFALVSWDKLKEKYNDFRDSVMLFHNLAQGVVLRELLESQTQLRQIQLRILADTSQTVQDIATNDVYRSGSSFASNMPTSKCGQESHADFASIADDIIAKGVALEKYFDRDPSLIIGMIFITHEEKARFVPVRAKYDTGSDANFIPSTLVERANLSSLLAPLEDSAEGSNVFIGLNNQEYRATDTVTLEWCASTMHKTRTTKFHVVDGVPYDMLLGNPFIMENGVFTPQRVAVPLRHKHRTAAERTAEMQRQQEHEVNAVAAQERQRYEDAYKRALEREARKIAQAQTSASTKHAEPSSSRVNLNTNTFAGEANPSGTPTGVPTDSTAGDSSVTSQITSGEGSTDR